VSDLIWSVYVQLSYNAYGDVAPAGGLPDDLARDLVPSPRLRWDPALWDDLIGWIVDAGANQLVLSLGDARFGTSRIPRSQSRVPGRQESCGARSSG
jgi:hypothetical protein